MSDSVIQLNSLSKWYGEVIGLNNVTASIGHGITGLVGPNGAGKSTLMGLVTGQLKPSMGHLLVWGRNPWDSPQVLARIGVCPEGDPFWSNLTGYQFVVFLARLSGMSLRQSRDSAREAIAATGMTENAQRAIKGYSKGMRQRIKVAQALVHKPDLLVLDEPFTGADPVGRHELAGLIKGLAEQGVDVLISSHVLHEVESLTRQILLIDHGRIVAQGDLHEVRETLRNRPHAIRVRVSRPRELAGKVAALEMVSGLTVTPDDALVIQTKTPRLLHRELMEMILAGDMQPTEIAAADESLEAVFGYLTQT